MRQTGDTALSLASLDLALSPRRQRAPAANVPSFIPTPAQIAAEAAKIRAENAAAMRATYLPVMTEPRLSRIHRTPAGLLDPIRDVMPSDPLWEP